MNTLAQVFAGTNVSVRTVADAVGEVWFSCTDVAKAVGYADAQSAVSSLMPDRKDLSEIEPPESFRGVGFSAIFGHQWKQAKVINLEMLNDFLMDSGKPQAKAFRKWVTGTVLPSIQKTGSFSMESRGSTETNYFDLTDEQVALMLLQNVREKNLLAEQMGLLNWYTQAQIRAANLWYGSRKAHKDLNYISEALGYEVRIRAAITSADIHNPTNMYHVEVFKNYAMRMGHRLVLPEGSTVWQLKQRHMLQLTSSNALGNAGAH